MVRPAVWGWAVRTCNMLYLACICDCDVQAMRTANCMKTNNAMILGYTLLYFYYIRLFADYCWPLVQSVLFKI